MTTKVKKRSKYEDLVLVGREPRTYESHLHDVSFFRDLVQATATNPALRDEATARLVRHQAEVALEQRTNPSTTTGQGGEFVPPGWLIEQFATPARAGRVFGDLVTNLPLPENVQSIHLPSISTGADAQVQSAQGQPVTDVDEVTADATSPVVTVTGESDVSAQLYDLTPTPPGYDGIVFADLSRAYNQSLERQLLAGSGTNGQLRGIQNVSGVGAVSYTSGSPTFAALWPVLGQAAATVGNTRLRPLDCWLVAPRRWAWMASSLDDQHRPIVSPGQGGPHLSDYPEAGGTLPTGPLFGKPAYEDGAIPAGTAADVIIGLHLASADFSLWESTPRLAVATNPLAGTLQDRVQLRRYAAFICTRPSSVVVVSGTGLAQPANF